MKTQFFATLRPFSEYSRYADSSSILCQITFHACLDGQEYRFDAESNDRCILQILGQIDRFLSGGFSADAELEYEIPWLIGEHCVYPYSFKVNAAANSWTFCFKDSFSCFSCELDLEQLLLFRQQLETQFKAINWQELGLTPLCSFSAPPRPFVWCYSAAGFSSAMQKLFAGTTLLNILVSARNYADPLQVKENFVNYYLGSEILIQTDGFLLDLLLHAEGLIQWRVFWEGEYFLTEPVLKLIEHGDNEFCRIGSVYGSFTASYTHQGISSITVDDTDSFPWEAKGFDESKLGDPVSLPAALAFSLANGCTLTFTGWDDDFVIRLSPPPA